MTTTSLAGLATAGVLVLAGCADDGGSSANTADEQTPASASPTESGSPSESASTDAGDEGGDAGGGDDGRDDGVEIEIEIAQGEVTPAGKRVTAKPGQKITLDVDSDTADELHLHSVPEQSFQVEATVDQEFSFRIEQPGIYELESHHTGTQIISLQIQP